jgi:hypothetical protein
MTTRPLSDYGTFSLSLSLSLINRVVWFTKNIS